MGKDLIHKFNAKIEIIPFHPCWEWTGAKIRNRYGIFNTGKNKLIYAHRFSWQSKNGPIPKGLLICHKCDNPGCVNPDHLFLGTQKENIQDASKKGRLWTGPRKTHCKRGHEFNNENTTPRGKNYRICKHCYTINQRDRRAKKKTLSLNN